MSVTSETQLEDLNLLGQLFRLMKSWMTRAKRYGSSLIWLMRQNLNLQPTLLFAVVGSSIVARIGPLAGFVLTIKALAILLSPDYGMRVFSALEKFGLAESISRSLIIFAPLIGFCGAAIGIWISSRLIERLIRLVSVGLTRRLGESVIVEAFRIREVRTRGRSLEPDTFGDDDDMQIDTVENGSRPNATKEVVTTAGNKPTRYVSDFSLAIRRIQRIERQFIMLCELAMVLVIAAIVGLYINAGFMVLVLIAGMTFGSFIIPFNQRRSHLLAERIADLSAELRETIASEVKDGSQHKTELQSAEQRYQKICDLVQRSTEQSMMFRSQARMAGIILQGLIIMGVLLVIAVEYSASPENVAQLGIMIVLVRYVLGTAQSMSNIAVGFGRDYPFLVEIINQSREPTPSSTLPSA